METTHPNQHKSRLPVTVNEQQQKYSLLLVIDSLTRCADNLYQHEAQGMVVVFSAAAVDIVLYSLSHSVDLYVVAPRGSSLRRSQCSLQV